MKKNIVYSFKDLDSTGINKLPEQSIISVADDSGDYYQYVITVTDNIHDANITPDPDNLQLRTFLSDSNYANDFKLMSGGGSGSVTHNEYNISATSAGQTIFTVANVIFDKPKALVYTNGIKDHIDEYSISDDGTDTTVTFNTGRNLDDWVNIVVIY
jgi:hypothetical protein